MKLGIKTTDDIPRLKIKTTDDITKAVECACCFNILFQEKYVHVGGSLADYRNDIFLNIGRDGESYFNTLTYSYSRTSSSVTNYNEFAYNGAFTVTDDYDETHSGTFTSEPITEKINEILWTYYKQIPQSERKTQVQSSRNRIYSHGVGNIIRNENFERDLYYVKLINYCSLPPYFDTDKCSCTNTSTNCSHSTSSNWETWEAKGSGSSSSNGSVTLSGQVLPAITETWARDNFNAESIDYKTEEPLTDVKSNIGLESSYTKFDLSSSIAGAKEYRLIFPASRSKKHPPSSDIYSPSPTGYLKVWLRHVVTTYKYGPDYEPISTYTIIDDLDPLIFDQTKHKSELLLGRFYTSQSYIFTDHLTFPIYDSDLIMNSRNTSIEIAGFTFDENYTGSTPPP